MGHFRRLAIDLLALRDQRADPIDLAAFGQRMLDALDHLGATRLLDHHRLHRRATGRQLVDHADVEVGVGGHGQRPRDRRRRHDQLMRGTADLRALLRQQQPLVHAETMLLIDHDQAQSVEAHRLLEQRMRADHHLGVTRTDAGRGGVAGARGLLAGEPFDGQAERREPGVEVAEVLLGEQFGRRHQAGLLPGLDRAQQGQRRDHGLARADVTLDQAHHRPRSREVGEALVGDAALRAGQRPGQAGDEALDQRLARRHQRRRALGVALLAQLLEREVVREQFLERQPTLGRMHAGAKLGQRGLSWRPVCVTERSLELRETVARAQALRQQFGERAVALELHQGLGGQAAQATLLQALGCRVDRRQRLGQPRADALIGDAVLRVHHLETARAAPRLAEAAQPGAARQAVLLRAREVEEAERQRAGAVADPREQLAAWPEHHFGQLDLAFDHHIAPTAERADQRDLRAVLVALRQVEQQVLDAADAEPREQLGELLADALQRGDRPLVEWRRCWAARSLRHRSVLERVSPPAGAPQRRARASRRPRPARHAAARPPPRWRAPDTVP